MSALTVVILLPVIWGGLGLLGMLMFYLATGLGGEEPRLSDNLIPAMYSGPRSFLSGGLYLLLFISCKYAAWRDRELIEKLYKKDNQ